MKLTNQTFMFKKHVGEGIKNVSMTYHEDTGEYFVRSQIISFFTSYVKSPEKVISAGKDKKKAEKIFKKESEWQT